MILADAGVLRFECPEFTVEFPAPTAPAPHPAPQVALPPGKIDEPDAPDPYAHLFKGNKPRLGVEF